MSKKISDHYAIEYVYADQPYRSGFGIERRKGWAVYNRDSGRDVRHGIESEAEAVEIALVMEAKLAAPAPTPPPAAAAPAPVVAAPAQSDRDGWSVRSDIHHRDGSRSVHYRNGAVEYHIEGMDKPMQIWDEA